MGILDFLKRLISSKQIEESTINTINSEEENVLIGNIESWFADKEVKIIQNAEILIKEKSPNLQTAVQNCLAALSALKTAMPRQPQLYEQQRSIADGNKQFFIISAENFLKTIKPPNSPSLLLSFVTEFEENFNSFMNNSNKSFVITNEFFTDQAVAIKTHFQEIDKIAQEIKEFCKQNKIEEFKKTKESIAKLMKKIQQAQQLKNELIDIENKFTNLLKQKETLSLEHSALLQSPSFSEKQNAIKELINIKNQLKAKENELYNIFGTLDAPLRKLAWKNLKLKNYINNYLNNLSKAVQEDKDFKFKEILIKLRCAIEAGEIELKDKKRNQTIAEINQLTNNFVPTWRTAYSELKEKETKLENEINNSIILKKELEIKTKLQMLEAEQETLNKNKEKINSKLKKLNLNEEVKELGNKLSSLTGHTVKISI